MELCLHSGGCRTPSLPALCSLKGAVLQQGAVQLLTFGP